MQDQPSTNAAPPQAVPAASQAAVLAPSYPNAAPHSTLVLDLAVPPTVNHAYVMVNGGRVLKTATRQYKAEVFEITTLLAYSQGFRLGAAYCVEIDLWFADRRRDVDNGVKIPLDSVFEALGANDVLVERIVTTRRGIDLVHPRCVITVHAYGSPPPPPKARPPRPRKEKLLTLDDGAF